MCYFILYKYSDCSKRSGFFFVQQKRISNDISVISIYSGSRNQEAERLIRELARAGPGSMTQVKKWFASIFTALARIACIMDQPIGRIKRCHL